MHRQVVISTPVSWVEVISEGKAALDRVGNAYKNYGMLTAYDYPGDFTGK